MLRLCLDSQRPENDCERFNICWALVQMRTYPWNAGFFVFSHARVRPLRLADALRNPHRRKPGKYETRRSCALQRAQSCARSA
jgi:hypothetical protein